MLLTPMQGQELLLKGKHQTTLSQTQYNRLYHYKKSVHQGPTTCLIYPRCVPGTVTYTSIAFHYCLDLHTVADRAYLTYTTQYTKSIPTHQHGFILPNSQADLAQNFQQQFSKSFLHRTFRKGKYLLFIHLTKSKIPLKVTYFLQ